MFKTKDKQGEEKQPKGSFFKRRGFRYGSMATIFTIGFIAIVILLNVLVSYLSDRFPISIDMTSDKNYKISAETVKFLKKVDKTVNVYICAPENAYLANTDYAPCVKIIDQYPQYNSDISITYIDLDKNPAFASRFPKESLSYADIIVASGDKYKKFASSDLLAQQTDSSTGQTQVIGDQTEQTMDSALEYLISNTLPEVVFTSGHNEQSATGLQSLLTKNNYNIQTKNLTTDTLDSMAQTLVVAAPTIDFSSNEIKKLDDFLNNGGKMGKNLVVFFDPQQSTLPNLEAYVKEWGVSVGNGVVYDKTNNYSNYFNPIEGTEDSTTVGSLTTGVHVDILDARPLTVLYSTKATKTAKSILSTMSTSQLWNPPAVTSQAAESFQPSSSDKAGPFDVMTRSTEEASYNGGNVTSNVIVSGSYGMINDSLLSVPNLSNANVIINTFNNIGGVKSDLNITTKYKSNSTLNIVGMQRQLIMIFYIAIIPLAILVAGLVIWLWRRHQ